MPVLEVRKLAVSLHQGKNTSPVLKGVSLKIFPNEFVGIVGESGSGKTVLAMSILRLLSPNIFKITGGEILFEEENILTISPKKLRTKRGNKIAMIFQEPMSSLNPVIKCGYQVVEILRVHTKLSKKECVEKTLQLFEKVKLPHPKELFRQYPHQVSGGQKQRIMIAMAIACNPKLLIADEPTTALDADTQSEIVTLIKELQEEIGMGVLFISHDLNLVKKAADRVVVIRHGEILENNTPKRLFADPQHPYTKALIFAFPKEGDKPKKLLTVDDFFQKTPPNITYEQEEEKQKRLQLMYNKPPLLQLKNISKEYLSKPFMWNKNKRNKVLEDINFSIYPRETVGLIGESGSGKSTLGNIILKLTEASTGQVFFNGIDITRLSHKQMKPYRSQIQIIFQDPFESLNPLITVGDAIMETLKVHHIGDNSRQQKDIVIDLLVKVGLEEQHFYRYPHQFSGGQRQRIGIARSIAMKPKLVVCDEVVSALDISVQAQVLNLLNDLKEHFGFSYLFISHDVSIVQYMSDRIIFLEHGYISKQEPSCFSDNRLF